MSVSAIPTRYAGCHFRSRLEARWAVFFDHLKLLWQYEPEGFALPSGWYLPDFWLPSLDAWWEVKGTPPDEQASKLAKELSEHTTKRVFTAWGPMPRYVDCGGYSDESRGIEFVEVVKIINDNTRQLENFVAGDIDYAFCVCPWCGKVGLEYNGRAARICGWGTHYKSYEDALAVVVGQGHWRADDKCYTANDSKIIAAYVAARSARFEHGQSGVSR